MRRYELVFDDQHREFITAASPTEAVAAREGGTRSKLPYAMTDLTAMRDWLSTPRTAPAEPAINEDAPLRRWPAKELA